MGVIKSGCGPLRMFALALLAFLVSTSEAEAQKLYWTVYHFDEIRHACLDGSHPHAVDMAEVSSPRAIAIDSLGRKIYWAKGAQSINRANLDGSEAEVIVDSYARQIAIDSTGGRIYWTRLGPSGNILRANLDGSDIEELVANQEHVYGIALDPPAGQMYWTIGLHFGDIVGEIWRANLDGSNAEKVYTTSPELAPKSIALDVSAGHLYWTSHGSYKGIWRANLDGSNAEVLIAFHPWSWGLYHIALDPVEGKIYYTAFEAFGPGRATRKADLDGANIETILTSSRFDYATGIALDLNPCGGPDCNGNGNPDQCDICDGDAQDCNGNDVPDECDIGHGDAQDCNDNAIPDDCEIDGDGDGFIDDCDACLDSDLAKLIAVEECPTGVTNGLLDDGCTMNDVLTECSVGARSHGKSRACVARHANEWRRQGLLSRKDVGRIARCAGTSNEARPSNRVKDDRSRGRR